MENRPPPAGTHKQACTGVAARFRPRWLRHYVATKLRSDPVFAAAYEILRESRESILDVGCGLGLLPFYLRERGLTEAIAGIDIDERKVRAGAEIAKAAYPAVELRAHDLRNAVPPVRGNVVLIDVLHYLKPSNQTKLLGELAAFVPSGGVFLIRDCPRDGSARYWLTHAGEIFAQTISWNLRTRLHFPSRPSIDAAFPPKEFTRSETPCWGGTPFNNHLFVFRRNEL